MKAIGIVAEYNPFHNGHIYQIHKIKEKYPDYAIVVVMSGCFMQRGDVALLNKWKRCMIALQNGVDLVVELPFPFSCQSADFFAYGAITILEHLKVERVVFGSETGSIEDLELIAKTQIDNPEFDALVKFHSRMGNNYPTSLSLALEELTHKKITTPNDLLGISYIKTIYKNHYNIIPETIKRTNDYHSTELGDISSATAIRKALVNQLSIEGQVPLNSLSYYNNLHFLDQYFPFLKYKILSDENLEKYQSVDEGIDSLLIKKLLKASSISELLIQVKNKRNTYNKLSRMIVHILCNFTKEKAKKFQDIKYIRILGFNKNGKNYLNSIKKDLTIPLISKIVREKDPMLEYEIQVTSIYDLVYQEGLVKREFEKIIYLGDDMDDSK